MTSEPEFVFHNWTIVFKVTLDLNKVLFLERKEFISVMKDDFRFRGYSQESSSGVKASKKLVLLKINFYSLSILFNYFFVILVECYWLR